MIDVGDTSCTIESLKILIDVQLFPDLLVIDIAGLYFRFIDLKQICAAHPELRSHPGDGLFLRGMPKWLDDPFSDMPKSDVQMIEDLIDDLAMFLNHIHYLGR